MDSVEGYKNFKQLKSSEYLSVYKAMNGEDKNVLIKFYNKNKFDLENFKYYQSQKNKFKDGEIPGFIQIMDLGENKENYYIIEKEFESVSLKEILLKQKLKINNFLRIAIKIIKILKVAEKYGMQIYNIDAEHILINLKKGRVKINLIHNQYKNNYRLNLGELFFYMITGLSYNNNIDMILSADKEEKNIFYNDIKDLIEGMICNKELYSTNALHENLEKIIYKYNEFLKDQNNYKIKNKNKSFYNIKKKKIQIIVLAIILFGIFFSIYRDIDFNTALEKKEIALVDIDTIKVKKISLDKKIKAMGAIVYRDKVAISSKIIGRIKNIYVEQGDYVKRGKLLAIVDTMSIELELKEMRSELKSALASYRLVKEKKNNARRNVERDIKNISKLKVKCKDRYNIMNNEKEIFSKQKEMYKVGGVTESDLNGYKLRYLSSISEFHIAKKEFEVKKIGYRDIDLKKAGYKKSKHKKEKNEILKIINTQVEKAEEDAAYNYISKIRTRIEILKRNIREGCIRTPISGVVGIRNIERGEFVKPDNDLFLIMNLKDVFVTTNLSEKDAGKIKIGQNVNFNVDAMGSRKFAGKVFLISPIVDETTRTIEVKILVKNNKRVLKPGMFVRADITTNRFKNKIFLNEKVILKNESKSYIFSYIKGRVYKKEIITGEKIDDLMEVVSEIKEGVIVASSNINLLSDRMKVNLILKNKNIAGNRFSEGK
jgi:RND family efflux transporter MFP subunit